MEKLSGGKVHRMDPTRPTLVPQASDPFMKAWLPGSLWLSSGSCSLLQWTAEANNLGPRPTHGEVFVRELEDGTRFIGVAVRVLDESRRVEFLWTREQQAILIKGLDQVFADARLDMSSDYVYSISCERAEDEEYGLCVAAKWTKARAARVKQRNSAGSAEQTPDEEPAAPVTTAD